MHKLLSVLIASGMAASIATAHSPRLKRPVFVNAAANFVDDKSAGDTVSIKGLTRGAGFSGPYPGLSAVMDYHRYEVGGFPIGDEYGAVGATTSAIVGSIRTPSGDVNGAQIFDAGVSGYAQTGNRLRDAIGLYGEGAILVDSASSYGLNTEVINCENHRSTCTLGAGLNMNQLWSVEADVSLYKKGIVAPTGSAAGVVAVVYAETQPTGQFNAFQVSRETSVPGSQPWKTGLTIGDGTASAAAIVVGGTATPDGIATPSMPVVFETYTATNAQMPVSLYADGSQIFHVTGQAFQVENGSNPALAVYNSSTNRTWELVDDASGNLRFYNPQTTKSAFAIATSLVSAMVPIQLSPQTFSALPACNSATAGALAYITDASAAITAWHQLVAAGGGANKAFVGCNGTGWYAFDY